MGPYIHLLTCSVPDSSKPKPCLERRVGTLELSSVGNEDLQLGVTEWRRDLTGGNHKKRCRKIDQEDAKTRSQKAGDPEDGAAWPNSPQAQGNECLQRAGKSQGHSLTSGGGEGSIRLRWNSGRKGRLEQRVVLDDSRQLWGVIKMPTTEPGLLCLPSSWTEPTGRSRRVGSLAPEPSA